MLENFESWMLWTLFLCAERAISFYICKSIVIIVPIFICVYLAYKYSILFHISGGIYTLDFWVSGSVKYKYTLLGVLVCLSQEFVWNAKTGFKIGIFPIPIAC